MDSRILKYFLAVASEENITKAAQQIHISQPTLSRQISQLEEEVGVQLFKRQSHNITLTNEGLLFKSKVIKILELEDQVLKEMKAEQDDLTGVVHIGCDEVGAMKYFCCIMSAFQNTHPKVQFHIFDGDTQDIKKHIDSGHADVGVLLEPCDYQKYHFVTLPSDEQWGLLVCDDSELAQLEAIMPENIAGRPLIVPHRKILQETIFRWCSEYYRDFQIEMEYNLLSNALLYARHRGTAIVCVRPSVQYSGMKFIPFIPENKTSSIFVWKKDGVFLPAAKRFIEFVEAYKK